MISRTFPLFTLIVTCLTLSLPLNGPTLISLPSRNNNTIPSSSPPPTPILRDWPPTPFTRHLSYDTNIEVLNRRPSPAWDPTSEMAVLEGISIIGAKARSRSRLATIEDFNEQSGPVLFRFHATEDLFRGADVAKVLDVLWHMTNLYGKGEVYGCLVRVGVHTAYLELELRKAEAVR